MDKIDGKCEPCSGFDKNGKLHSALNCPKCGNDTEVFGNAESWMENYAFCPWCGARLEPECPFAEEVDEG